jgi:hypothetical protein
MTVSMSVSHHFLLWTPWLHLPPPQTMMMHPMGSKMIVVTTAHLIRCKMVVVTAKMESALLRVPRHQRG